MYKKGLLLVSLVFFMLLLTACGVKGAIDSNYAYTDTVLGSQGNESNVYTAFDKSVPEVVEEINKLDEAKKISEEDEERMIMVYDDSLVQVMKDVENPKNSLIEVASREFVNNNYGPSFFEVYGMMALADDIFDFDEKKKSYYGGYVNSSGKYTKNASSSGSIRFGSTSNGGSFRGGSFGSGK